MTNAQNYKQRAGIALALEKIVGPLIVKEIVDHLLNECETPLRAAICGEGMCTLKARSLAKVIDTGVTMAKGKWKPVLYQQYNVQIRDWSLDSMTYRATGRNQLLNTMQNVSQLLTQKGFKVDFTWEVVNEYTQFQNESAPETIWGTAYETKRTITIYKATREAYPELELPKSGYQIHKQFDTKAWMQVRPAINIRWGLPSEEKIQALADKFLFEITASDDEKALVTASNLDSNDRMLRIAHTRDDNESLFDASQK
jgi:hypothetical protein